MAHEFHSRKTRLWVARIAAVAGSAAILGWACAWARDNGGVQDFLMQSHRADYADAFRLKGTNEPIAPVLTVVADRRNWKHLAYRSNHLAKRGKVKSMIAKVWEKPAVLPAIVTIYNDPTLRRGDAIMTRRGLIVFNGPSVGPYKDTDFTPVAEARGLSGLLRRTLLAIDAASHLG